jgi:hypothetical protein
VSRLIKVADQNTEQEPAPDDFESGEDGIRRAKCPNCGLGLSGRKRTATIDSKSLCSNLVKGTAQGDTIHDRINA